MPQTELKIEPIEALRRKQHIEDKIIDVIEYLVLKIPDISEYIRIGSTSADGFTTTISCPLCHFKTIKKHLTDGLMQYFGVEDFNIHLKFTFDEHAKLFLRATIGGNTNTCPRFYYIVFESHTVKRDAFLAYMAHLLTTIETKFIPTDIEREFW